MTFWKVTLFLLHIIPYRFCISMRQEFYPGSEPYFRGGRPKRLFYGVLVTVQIILASNQVLHCLLIEFIIIIRMKLLITTQQPLNLKWIRLIDRVSDDKYKISITT